jgi:hypothetical protein
MARIVIPGMEVRQVGTELHFRIVDLPWFMLWVFTRHGYVVGGDQ